MLQLLEEEGALKNHFLIAFAVALAAGLAAELIAVAKARVAPKEEEDEEEEEGDTEDRPTVLVVSPTGDSNSCMRGWEFGIFIRKN